MSPMKNQKKSHCPQGHVYDEENTFLRKDEDGYVHRHCRECGRANAKAHYAKKVAAKKAEQERVKAEELAAAQAAIATFQAASAG